MKSFSLFDFEISKNLFLKLDATEKIDRTDRLIVDFLKRRKSSFIFCSLARFLWTDYIGFCVLKMLINK
mgnify:FL=1